MECVVGRTLTVLVALSLAGAATLPSKPTTDKAQQFVDKCRSHCVIQTTPDSSRRSCLEGEQCLRCWAACKAFQSEHFIREYCKHNKACTSGCRQACLFYLGQLERRPVRSGQPLTPPSVGSSQVETAPPLVVGLRQGPDSEPDSVSYSFVDGQRRPFDRPDTEIPPHRPVQVDWRPRLAGMTFTVSLVSATVSWPARGVGAQYLVTWELLSGGLRGHLVSAETTASLPLWPDEQYLVQVFCDGEVSQPLQLDTHQKLHEGIREAVSEVPSQQVGDNTSDAVPKSEKEEISMPDVGPQSYSDPESYSTDSYSEESESTAVTQLEVTTGLMSSQSEPSSDDQQTAAELTHVSPLESAALVSDSDSPLTQPSSLPSGSAGAGERRAASPRPPLRSPTLLALLTTLLLLLVVVGVTLASRACSRSHQHRHHHHHHHQQQQQRQQRVVEAEESLTDDRRTLLGRRQAPRRAGAALHASSDPRYTPIFIVPCHKR